MLYRSHRVSRIALAATLAATLSLPAAAQSQPEETGEETGANLPATTAEQSEFHDRNGNNQIIVSALLNTTRQDALSGVGVLSGAELTAQLKPAIGDVLTHIPGVSATSFGPSASRPVLRGLQGERVRVLTNGLGAIDVSNTSVDHAPVVNTLLADRIEVLRGPQSLLYGSSAIGGVVNVIDHRIPNAVPDEPIHVGALLNYGSAANERSASASVDVPIGGGWVVNANGSYLKTDDLKIGGYALTPELREQALASAQLPADPDEEPIDFAANAAVRGTLPNTASETWTAGGGVGYVTDGGSLGVSYSHYDSLYGIPIRFATEPGQEQEGPRLDLVQNRIDAKAEVTPASGFFDSISMRYGYANYRHFELEESGEVGTAFYNQGHEGRLEFSQRKRGVWSGAFGGQFFTRDFDVVGEEAFLPKNSTEQVGLFTVQQFDFGPFKVEAGGRYERSYLQAKPTPDQPQFFDGKRDFDTLSGSLGGLYRFGNGWSAGLNLSRTERAPAAEELFANGPHAGTEAFEVGNPDFTTEKATSVEAILHGRGNGYSIDASAYYSWFSDFIYDSLTGEVEDGLPVYQFAQADARYYGFEVQGTADVASFGEGNTIVADALADYTRATIETTGPAPRIPPLRVLGGLTMKTDKFDVRGEVEWTDRQSRVAEFETETPSFTLVNAEATIRPWGTDRPLSFVVSANNIFDVNARRHASFLKDYAPLAGRDFRVSARLDF